MRYTASVLLCTGSEGGSGPPLEADMLGLGGGGRKICPRDFPWEEVLSLRLIFANERVSSSADFDFRFFFLDLDFEREESELESESELEEVESVVEDCFLLRLIFLDSLRILSPFLNALAFLTAFRSIFFFSSLRISLSVRSADFSLLREDLGGESPRAGPWNSGWFEGKLDL
jgi:hypothetical protein